MYIIHMTYMCGHMACVHVYDVCCVPWYVLLTPLHTSQMHP